MSEQWEPLDACKQPEALSPVRLRVYQYTDRIWAQLWVANELLVKLDWELSRCVNVHVNADKSWLRIIGCHADFYSKNYAEGYRRLHTISTRARCKAINVPYANMGLRHGPGLRDCEYKIDGRTLFVKIPEVTDAAN